MLRKQTTTHASKKREIAWEQCGIPLPLVIVWLRTYRIVKLSLILWRKLVAFFSEKKNVAS